MSQDFPYKDYMDATAWKVIESALADLVENKDIVITTHQDYVIGYLVKALVDNSADSPFES